MRKLVRMILAGIIVTLFTGVTLAYAEEDKPENTETSLSVGPVQAAEVALFKEPTQGFDDFMAYKGIKVFVNGRYVEFNDDLGYPIAMNGRIYIPVRVVSETINADVDWFQRGQEVSISKYENQVKIKLGENYIGKTHVYTWWRTEEKLEMDASAFAENGRIYVPFRALFEAFGMNVTWNDDTQTAYATSDYESNTECIDFKSYKILEIVDIDDTKTYRKIVYDGVPIDRDYIHVLESCSDYKVLEDGDTLSIFSYQYLFDINYLYRGLIWRRNNKEWYEGFPRSWEYKLYCTVDKEHELIQEIQQVNSWIVNSSGVTWMDEFAGVKEYYLGPQQITPEEFKEIDEIADKIVAEVKAEAADDATRVALVNKALCNLLEYGDENRPNSNLYDSLVSPRKVTCGGYTSAFSYLMNKLGIDCIAMSGAMHIWNEVLVDGEWKIVDVTWNDTGGGPDDEYLLLDYTESIKEDTNILGEPFYWVSYNMILSDGTIHTDGNHAGSPERRSYEQLVKYTMRLTGKE